MNVTLSNLEVEELPNNDSLIKAISYKEEEARAMDKINKFEMIRPDMQEKLGSGDVKENVKREYKPYELQLKEINSFNELVYIEEISLKVNSRGQIIDKRFLMPHQYTFKKYVFNVDSIFMNYLYLNETTRMLFLFRRLNSCQHKFSCIESIMRRLYKFMSVYTTMIRLPIHLIMKKYDVEVSKTLIGIEVFTMLMLGIMYAGGSCLIRYLHEEVI